MLYAHDTARSNSRGGHFSYSPMASKKSILVTNGIRLMYFQLSPKVYLFWESMSFSPFYGNYKIWKYPAEMLWLVICICWSLKSFSRQIKLPQAMRPPALHSSVTSLVVIIDLLYQQKTIVVDQGFYLDNKQCFLRAISSQFEEHKTTFKIRNVNYLILNPRDLILSTEVTPM